MHYDIFLDFCKILFFKLFCSLEQWLAVIFKSFNQFCPPNKVDWDFVPKNLFAKLCWNLLNCLVAYKYLRLKRIKFHNCVLSGCVEYTTQPHAGSSVGCTRACCRVLRPSLNHRITSTTTPSSRSFVAWPSVRTASC